MNIIIANFGNGSIALIQWAIEHQLSPLMVLSVDTGWQSEYWQQRITLAQQFLQRHQINHQHLNAQRAFEDCVKDRGSFPSKKFQWCAPFLKGLTLNATLDELDPLCEAVILLPKQKCLSRSHQNLVSGQLNELYNDRQIDYPLLEEPLEARDQLIGRAGFEVLNHPSQECFPCIHSTHADLQLMSTKDKHRLEMLEAAVNQKMLSDKQLLQTATVESYDMGCGNIWGCGD